MAANLTLISQTCGYIVSVILSFCVVIPTTWHLLNFKGHCLLYSGGTFVADDGRFEPSWSSSAYCGYTLFVGSFMLIISVVQLVRMMALLCKKKDSSFLAAFVDAVVAVTMSVLIVVDAVFVTAGFSYWCNAVTERFASCQDASVMKIGVNSGINPNGFFVEMGSVQFGIWMSLVSWVLLLVLASRKLFVYHERENMIVSMARERQRYTNSGYQGVDN